MQTTYTVRYLDFAGNIKRDRLTVHPAIDTSNRPVFIAENLATLGSGKYGHDHNEALSRLVLDHGQQLLNYWTDDDQATAQVFATEI
jgi:hypothetical protein